MSVRFALVATLAAGCVRSASAQLGLPQQFELSPSIQIEDIDDTDAKPQLARLNAYIARAQWDEAVEALRKISEEQGPRVVQLEDRRYVTVRDYCHLKIAALPPEALAMYRARVDQVAGDWYRQAVKSRDERLLRSVAEKLLCSSVGDDALLALGDIALEQGNHDAARAAWQQISALTRGADGQQAWQVLHGVRRPEEWEQALPQFRDKPAKINWVAYPDTDINLADVRARLVLCSILEGSRERANVELEWFRRLHPQASGKLAGRDGPYGQTLADLLAASDRWPAATASQDWFTFAGDFERSGTAARRPPLSGRPTWDLSLSTLTPAVAEPPVPNHPLAQNFRRLRLRPMHSGENEDQLAHHPLIVGNVVLIANQHRVFAFESRTGKPAWPRAGGLPGQIYPGASDAPGERDFPDRGMFGEPQYTMTMAGGLLFVRIGSSVTARTAALHSEPTASRLVCLRPRNPGGEPQELWRYPSHKKLDFDDGRWAIEGAPVCDGQTVYLGLRRSTFQSEAHVAALDAGTGRLLWQRRVCAADTPGHGLRSETTHNLLTLHGDTLYYNTNLGAVAALAKRDGTVRWVYRYERARGGRFDDLPRNFQRDLNPCIYHEGLVLAAPTDNTAIFALDADTGLMTWNWPFDKADDEPRQLLGVGNGNLIAAGNCIWWFDVATGKASGEAMVWPAPTLDGESGLGRGLLAEGRIYWPTQEEIIVLDQNWQGRGSPIVDRIQLTRPDTGDRLTGGNLAYARGTLVVTTPKRLIVFHAPQVAERIVPAGRSKEKRE